MGNLFDGWGGFRTLENSQITTNIRYSVTNLIALAYHAQNPLYEPRLHVSANRDGSCHAALIQTTKYILA